MVICDLFWYAAAAVSMKADRALATVTVTAVEMPFCRVESTYDHTSEKSVSSPMSGGKQVSSSRAACRTRLGGGC